MNHLHEILKKCENQEGKSEGIFLNHRLRKALATEHIFFFLSFLVAKAIWKPRELYSSHYLKNKTYQPVKRAFCV